MGRWRVRMERLGVGWVRVERRRGWRVALCGSRGGWMERDGARGGAKTHTKVLNGEEEGVEEWCGEGGGGKNGRKG